MCLTLNSAMEWAGSTFQVVVAVCGRAAAVVLLMGASFYRIDSIRIDIDISDIEYNDKDSHFCRRAQIMEERKKPPEALHAWLIILKAWQSMSHYVFPALLEEGLGESDFRVLEVLLHK